MNAPKLGDIVIARGIAGRTRGEIHTVAILAPHTTWTRPLPTCPTCGQQRPEGAQRCDAVKDGGLTCSGALTRGSEDFVGNEIFWKVFQPQNEAPPDVPDFMLYEEALVTVAGIATAHAVTERERVACGVVEDYIVNHLGED